MPTINRPRSFAEIFQALQVAKLKADVTAPADLAFSTATLARLTAFLPTYQTEMQEMASALAAQGGSTNLVNVVQPRMKMHISHFIQVFNFGIEREIYAANDRGFYFLPLDEAKVPEMQTEAQVGLWGLRIVSGDTARVAAGGAAMANPSAAQVAAVYADFIAAQGAQTTKKTAYDNEQEDVAEISVEGLDIVDDIWDECEFTFRKEAASSKRRKCREYGVVYTPRPGETPSPEDFSIIGKITDGVTNAAVGGVQLTVVETGAAVLSDGNGNYYVGTQADGTYTLRAEKTGYYTLTIPNVQVTAGSLTTKNIPLLSQTNSGNTMVVSGSYLSPETVTANLTGVNTTPVSLVGVEVFNSPAGFFASETDAGLPIGIRYDRNPGTIIYLLVEDFKTLIGFSPTKQVIRVQNIGMVPGSYALNFMNLE